MEDMLQCGLCGNWIAEELAIMGIGFEPLCCESCRDRWNKEYNTKFNTGQNNISSSDNNK